MILKTLEVLHFILTTRSSAKLIRAGLSGDFSQRRVDQKLSYLKRKGYLVRKENGMWELSARGKKYYREAMEKKFLSFSPKENKNNDFLLVFF